MSTLDETLDAVRATVGGVRAAVLVGLDGVVVAGSFRDGGASGWDLVSACYAGLLRNAVATGQEARLESPTELVVASPSAVLVMRAVTPEYALLAALDGPATLGRARWELRKAADRILPEIA